MIRGYSYDCRAKKRKKKKKKKISTSNMAAVAAAGVWRRVTFWLWFCCLVLAVYSLPVNEEESVSVTINADQSGDLGPAIEAIEKARAKRNANRKKSSKSGRSLVRYRYPINVKRSGNQEDDNDLLMAENDGMMSDDEEDERPDSLAALLGPDESDSSDNAVSMNDLAKEMALDILMEELEKEERINEHRSTGASSSALHMKRKKAAPAAHRPSISPRSSLDDKRRKRMNSIVHQLLESQDGQPDGQDNEYALSDNEDTLLMDQDEPEDDQEDDQDDDQDDDIIQNAMTKALANQGLDSNDIQALLSELQRFQAPSADETDDFKADESKKKKRNSEWRKLPRASLRWRFLHGVGDNGDNIHSRHHHNHQNEEEDEPLLDKSIPFEHRFFGRGFHRVGPTIPDDSGRVVPSVTAKRVQHPLKTKNVVNKRSIDVSQQTGRKEQMESAAPLIRKRRSSSSTEAGGSADQAATKLNQTIPPPLALPSTESTAVKKANHTQKTDDNEAAKASPKHSGVIRKKSVDWDDYFGYDKRSSGSGSRHPDDETAMKDFLESEYYKSLAGSLAFRKRGQQMDHHASHLVAGGMRKRSNQTTLSQKKRRSGNNVEDVEEALDAAYRAIQDRRDYDDLDRVREQLVAEWIENLDEDQLDEMTERLSEELANAIGDQEDHDEDDLQQPMKRSSGNTFKHKKNKKKSLKDERRKRFAIKRSQNARHRTNNRLDSDGILLTFR